MYYFLIAIALFVLYTIYYYTKGNGSKPTGKRKLILEINSEDLPEDYKRSLIERVNNSNLEGKYWNYNIEGPIKNSIESYKKQRERGIPENVIFTRLLDRYKVGDTLQSFTDTEEVEDFNFKKEILKNKTKITVTRRSINGTAVIGEPTNIKFTFYDGILEKIQQM